MFYQNQSSMPTEAQGEPLKIENMPYFQLGPRSFQSFEIVKPGDPEKQTLNFCRLKGQNGFFFEGYVALINVGTEEDKSELVLDSGTLRFSDGTTFSGQFSITFSEEQQVRNLHFLDTQGLIWSEEPYIFYGTITSPHGEIFPNLWAAEDIMKQKSITQPNFFDDNYEQNYSKNNRLGNDCIFSIIVPAIYYFLFMDRSLKDQDYSIIPVFVLIFIAF